MAQVDVDNAEDQARAQYESIAAMVERLRQVQQGKDGIIDEEWEEAREAVLDNALSVDVRGPWCAPGSIYWRIPFPVEFQILLCTGGPAVRIVGDLDTFGEPESAGLECQDWFTPWKSCDWADGAILLAYCREFYFGD